MVFRSKCQNVLSGCSASYIKNSHDFTMKIKDLKLRDNELMLSFDVVSLFAQVPIDDALHIIRDRSDLTGGENYFHSSTDLSPD